MGEKRDFFRKNEKWRLLEQKTRFGRTQTTMAFRRPVSPFRLALGSAEFPFERDRYILYVSLACPWATGVYMAARLKGLFGTTGGDVMRVCVVHPTWQYTDPDKDQNLIESGFAAGVSRAEPHAGWIFARPGEPILPLAVMKAAPELGLLDQQSLPVGFEKEICKLRMTSGEQTAEYSNPEETPGKQQQASAVTLDAQTVAAVAKLTEELGVRSRNCSEDVSGHRASSLREIYERAGARMQDGIRATTPMLWDTHTDRIVNNESTDLIRYFNDWGKELSDGDDVDLYPTALQSEVDAMVPLLYAAGDWTGYCYAKGFLWKWADVEFSLEQIC